MMLLIATIEDGDTCLDDVPETPAPLFAVRAFRSAIFGTPVQIEYQVKGLKEESPRERDLKKDEAKVGPEPAKTISREGIAPTEDQSSTQRISDLLDTANDINHDQMASPTKGILLTPGTATTKRKTVSFSARRDFRERTKSPDNTVESQDGLSGKGKSIQHSTSKPQRKQSSLTRTLIGMSTKRRNPPAATAEPAKSGARSPPTKPIAENDTEVAPELSEPVSDMTIDLSQPRSRSGQHWKAEYEEYHKNSTREMKKIVQYGQNVKSYAARKDLEATRLGENLNKELAKVARMESRISKLAKQLKMASAQGPGGESEQARLVGELAQQTAMTVRYQRKADHYRKAITRQSANDLTSGQDQVVHGSLLEDKENPSDLFEMATIEAQLEGLRDTATAAESRAAKLETENKQLKRNLARVKEEMLSYESRRQAREDRLKKREQRHKASKEHCETELANLKLEHHRILQATQVNGNQHMQPVPANVLHIDQKVQPLHHPKYSIKDAISSSGPVQDQQKQDFLSRKQRSQKPNVDIWTLSSSNETPKQSLRNKDTTDLAPSSVKCDIDRALNEIDRNLAALEPESSSQIVAAPEVLSHIGNVLETNKSSSKRDTADGVIPAPTSRQFHPSTVGRSASLLSHPIGSRTNTMGSTRTSSLSAERAAAAKARLAERKKSGEKKIKDRIRVDGLERDDEA